MCYKCHNVGHYASECPSRNLTIESIKEDDDPNLDDEYNLDFEPSDDECDSEDRVSFFRFASTHHTKEEKERMNESEICCMLVVRCVVTLQEDDDWRQTTIFYTYVKCNDRTCKIIIDSGSRTNVVSSHILLPLGLKPEAHPKPYRVCYPTVLSPFDPFFL